MHSDALHEEAPWAVIVTYNRKALLTRCIGAMHAQTLPPRHLVIVDNASSDGTPEALDDAGLLSDPAISYLRLDNNEGGAGGFARGMAYALEMGARWVWVMDDDALPSPDALAALMRERPSPCHLYASAAGTDGLLAWPLKSPPAAGARVLRAVTDVPSTIEVENVPFLGLLVHRDLIARIGLPSADFFIAADDTEFCVRARANGASIFVAGLSRISHPNAQVHTIRIGPLRLAYLELPPWKRYYDTRNRLLIARRHYGPKLWTHTLPGSLIRAATAVLRGPARRAQLKAAFAGIYDGLRGRAGRRHDIWNIAV